MNNIQSDVKQFLLDLDLYRAPICPKVVCQKLKIEYNEQPYEGFEGLLLIDADTQLIGVSSNIINNERKLFTCAHELGHYHYDSLNGANIICRKEDILYGKDNQVEMEVRANKFASELLLPTEFILNDIFNRPPSIDLIKQLATKYKTSLQAAAYKYIITSHHTCWLIIGNNGKLIRYAKADHNDFIVDLTKTFKAPKMRNEYEWVEVQADSWLYPNARTKNKKLSLTWLPANRYGDFMLLLWDQRNLLHSDANDYGDESDY